MKATGIVRRIDDLGRVIIPKEIRRTLRIREGDPLEIFLDNSNGLPMVCFQKYTCFTAEDSVVCSVGAALASQGLIYAIFTTAECIASNCPSFPKDSFTPTNMEDIRCTVYDNEQKATIVPITNDGDCFGWVLVKGSETDEHYNFASFVATILSRQLDI